MLERTEMALVDELRAMGAYLEGAKNFPATYESSKSHQLQVALSLASREAWTPTQATAAITLLQEQLVWSNEERNEIVVALQQGMARRPTVLVPGQRLSQQDHTNICTFFSEAMWDYVWLDTESVANKVLKVTAVTAFAIQLGLQLFGCHKMVSIRVEYGSTASCAFSLRGTIAFKMARLRSTLVRSCLAR